VSPVLVVRPEGSLDLDEARRLVGTLEALPPGVRVHVDVSTVRDVHPTGLAFLAYALDRDGRVTLGGLRRQHERLLAYLLAEPPAPTSTAASTATA
jgi:ABC-type transporter Mla MlaB component